MERSGSGIDSPQNSNFILDFYHACEHVSVLCKHLYGEQTPEYWKNFKRWKAMLFAGKPQKVLQELHKVRDSAKYGPHRDFIQGEINYFNDNKKRMRYDLYRASKLPIGSGTIESACKNVIGAA